MKRGLFRTPMRPPEKPHADAHERDIETLVAADRLGYSEPWHGEHFTSDWENMPAPDLIIGAPLQQTHHIRLGTGAACRPKHNPIVLAHRIAQLDQMARGSSASARSKPRTSQCSVGRPVTAGECRPRPGPAPVGTYCG